MGGALELQGWAALQAATGLVNSDRPAATKEDGAAKRSGPKKRPTKRVMATDAALTIHRVRCDVGCCCPKSHQRFQQRSSFECLVCRVQTV